MRITFKVTFVLKNEKRTVSEIVAQKDKNAALNAAIAKYFRNNYAKKYSPSELQRQIAYQIAWCKRTPRTYSIKQLNPKPTDNL